MGSTYLFFFLFFTYMHRRLSGHDKWLGGHKQAARGLSAMNGLNETVGHAGQCISDEQWGGQCSSSRAGHRGRSAG